MTAYEWVLETLKEAADVSFVDWDVFETTSGMVVLSPQDEDEGPREVWLVTVTEGRVEEVDGDDGDTWDHETAATYDEDDETNP